MAKPHTRWEQVVPGTCCAWKSTSRVVNLAERHQQEGGRKSHCQGESGSRTPVIIMFVQFLGMEREGTLEKQIEPCSSLALWQTEGLTTRSVSPGVTKGEHLSREVNCKQN